MVLEGKLTVHFHSRPSTWAIQMNIACENGIFQIKRDLAYSEIIPQQGVYSRRVIIYCLFHTQGQLSLNDFWFWTLHNGSLIILKQSFWLIQTPLRPQLGPMPVALRWFLNVIHWIRLFGDVKLGERKYIERSQGQTPIEFEQKQEKKLRSNYEWRPLF